MSNNNAGVSLPVFTVVPRWEGNKTTEKDETNMPGKLYDIPDRATHLGLLISNPLASNFFSSAYPTDIKDHEAGWDFRKIPAGCSKFSLVSGKVVFR